MTLRPEQIEAVTRFRSTGNLLLVAEAGAGKSYVASGVISDLPPSARVLYLCRAAAIKEQQSKVGRTDITTYASHESILGRFKEWQKVKWEAVIVDESHRWLNWTSKRVKCLMKLEARQRLMMSATPIPNGLKEAGVILKWLRHPCAEPWGCYTHYKNAELIENPYVPGMITGVKRPVWLADRLAEVTHEMKTDHVAVKTVEVKVELGSEQRTAYDELVKESIIDVQNGVLTATTPAILQLRCRQFTSHPLAVGHTAPSAKEDMLIEMLKTIKPKIIIFTCFATVARLLAERHGWALIEGATSKKERERILAEHPDVLVMTSAGEESLDCEWADTVITYDLPFHDGHLAQQAGRANRYGRTGTVTHYVLKAVNTVDDKNIMRIIRRKINDAKKLHEAVCQKSSAT